MSGPHSGRRQPTTVPMYAVDNIGTAVSQGPCGRWRRYRAGTRFYAGQLE